MIDRWDPDLDSFFLFKPSGTQLSVKTIHLSSEFSSLINNNSFCQIPTHQNNNFLHFILKIHSAMTHLLSITLFFQNLNRFLFPLVDKIPQTGLWPDWVTHIKMIFIRVTKTFGKFFLHLWDEKSIGLETKTTFHNMFILTTFFKIWFGVLDALSIKT